jgi:hypothetical protein
LIIAFLSIVIRARHTYVNYYLRTLNNQAVALTNHIYDFVLADVMAVEGDEETGYILPLDSGSGALFPESSTLAFMYQGQAAYVYIWDDEATLFDDLQQLANGKTRIGVIRWKVSKHTGADPKHVFDYALQKWGACGGRTQHQYFDVDYFDLNAEGFTIGPAPMDALNVPFENNLVLVGTAMDQDVAAGDLLWVELAWRKAADFPEDYQVALWLEDRAGHRVGQVDKPLMSNLWHQRTGAWSVGATERDYYLVPIDPTTPIGTYRLKMVLYSGEGGGRRLAPALSGIGADLAVMLGEVTVKPPSTPPDLATLSIPQRLDHEVGDGLWLLGFDPGFTGPLRPGDRATLNLWWQAKEPPSKNLAVIVGMGQGEQAWSLSELQPLGGADYPTRDWPAGAVVRTPVDLHMPPDVETGGYNLGMRLLDAESGITLAGWVLGRAEVMGRTRDFNVPPMMHHVEANFGRQVTLLGYDLDLSRVGEGGPVRLNLYWQAQSEIDTAYKVFVHLLDESQQIVSQVDRVPQGGEAPTTGWLAGEVVMDEIEVSMSAEMTGVRSIAVGLYDQFTGKRVPVLNVEGATVGDHVMLPIR